MPHVPSDDVLERPSNFLFVVSVVASVAARALNDDDKRIFRSFETEAKPPRKNRNRPSFTRKKRPPLYPLLLLYFIFASLASQHEPLVS